MMDDSLKQAYRRAGNDFLAKDLECMFRVIKTPDDIATHNIMQAKVFEMIGQDKIHATMFYRALSHKLLLERSKKTFLQNVAAVIVGEKQE